jgi:type IV secretory pathway protease TraF
MRLGRLMRIQGHSMAPALRPGTLVLVGARPARPPRRGEVVAARPAALGGRAVVKRVAGLPGERVEHGGRAWQLGDDEYFLLGDRPEDSLDSRAFGPVADRDLLGPVGTFLSSLRKFRAGR